MLERTVHWTPATDAPAFAAPLGAAPAAEPLVVRQQALLDVATHVASAKALAFGILYGAVYRCPRLEMNYVLVEGAQRGSIDDTSAGETVHSALEELIARLRAVGVHALGWYRTGTTFGAHLPSADIAMHAALFQEPWMVALIQDSSTLRPDAAFLRLADRRRPRAIPFYELLPGEIGDREPTRSAVAWSMYRTNAPVAGPKPRYELKQPFDASTTSSAPDHPLMPARRTSGRVRLFEPPSHATPVRAPMVDQTPAEPPPVALPGALPGALPVGSQAGSPAGAPRRLNDIESIFEPADSSSTLKGLDTAPRGRRFPLPSFASRAGLGTFAAMAIAIAILAAWFATH